MRPVARIAQSVEQGIENPRVLGSIPSPGTIFRETSLTAGFLLSGVSTLHRTRSIIRPASSAHPYGAVASDVQHRCAGCPSPGTTFKETSLIAGFLLSDVWTLHQTGFDYSPCKQVSPLRGRRKRRSTPLRGLSEIDAFLLELIIMATPK